ncbi:MAG: hypothetical protein II719_05170, partial [Clostridia bacterium]|nr:hypothetical protein [Clostridia bacterium]
MTRYATGCLPLTRDQEKRLEAAVSAAVSLPEYSWQNESDMPVIRWDDAFDRWLDRRIALADKYQKKGLCLLPWEVYKALPASARKTNVYAWNQGSLPSCSMHGAVHAFQTSLLTAIALGSPLEYEA